nr:MAG TPA: hypothetical protein [Caudoviricetes sp.]
MYSHQDKERFATRIVLIVTVPFVILTAIAIIEAVRAAL